MKELVEYRSEFPILEQTTYLINHSLGAMPRGAEEGLAEYARTWRERGIRGTERRYLAVSASEIALKGRHPGTVPGTRPSQTPVVQTAP